MYARALHKIWMNNLHISFFLCNKIFFFYKQAYDPQVPDSEN